MKPHSQDEHKQQTFEYFCKQILKNEKNDYHRELNQQGERAFFSCSYSSEKPSMIFFSFRRAFFLRCATVLRISMVCLCGLTSPGTLTKKAHGAA